MTTEDELATRRVAKAKDCKEVRPVDLLRAMADDIEKGTLKADGLVLCYIERTGADGWEVGSYRCGITRDAQLILLELVRDRTKRDWLNRGEP